MARMLIVVLFLCLVVQGASAQGELSVSGRIVVAGTNEPLAGANIRVRGSSVGTTSDINGMFRVSVRDVTEATLVISYLGYKTVEMRATSTSGELRIAMQEDVLKTSEVVVTGLASSVKRENLANAVATISARELVSVPAQTLDQALSGKFAGISVSQNTGAPGGGMNVQLRGVTTIEGRTQPLYVVDGLIINNDATQSGVDLVTKAAGAGSANPQGQPVNRIADINPNDVENIEVLKGASAAAIYGSKASNGVIIISTKQGGLGGSKIDVNQQFGFNSILRKIGARKFTAQTAQESYGAQGLALFNQGGGQFIDYEDELYGETGFINESVISGRGGTEELRYFGSVLARTEDGLVKGTGYKKYGVRLNLSRKFSDDVRVNGFFSTVRTEADRAVTGNDNTNITFGFSWAFTPSFLDIRPRNGVYPDHPFNPSNPLHTRDLFTNNELVNRTIAALQLSWTIFRTENQVLSFIAQGGGDFYSQENKVVSPPELQYERSSTQPGASLLGQTTNINSNLYLNLVHNYITPSNISFRTSAGVQVETKDYNNALNEARGLTITQTNIQQAASVNAFQTLVKQRDQGFYVQEEVDLNERIFLTASVRGDASSTVGDTKKYFFYPKASASLRLSQFDFWQDYSGAVEELKLRAAYGETGNLAPAEAKYTSLLTSNVGGLGGLLPATRRGAKDIVPERKKELELGLDAGFLDGHGVLEFTYYTQNITDLILIRTLPRSSGYTDEFINAGAMKTQGVEVSLGLTPFRSSEFNWTTRLNFFKTSSEISELDVPAFNKGGFATFLGTYRIEVGKSPTTIIGSEQNPDGTPKQLGDETPDFQLSWSNRFNYKNFELTFLWEWKQGGDVINLGKLISDLGATTFDYDELGTFKVGGKDTVMKKGPGRLFVLGTQTAPYIEDGTYIKLRELSVTYNVSPETVNALFGSFVSYLRIGVSGRNLLMFTDYTGYDPEVSQFGNVAIG
ncbi:MAG: SusC/RagA family TonB-linked outer membrane protein, partial [Bacteroidota bacterium]